MSTRFSAPPLPAVLPAIRPLIRGMRHGMTSLGWLLATGLSVSGTVFATDATTAANPATTTTNTITAPKQLEEVEVVGTARSALTQAPSQADLTITQPQSIIGLDWISNHVAPTADYATIAAIAPGVTNVSPAGPGLGESKQLTLRGFNDNQYNVTYDGIPFGDTNDFSHHTSSYFPAKMIGQVLIDRGPGNASTIGAATFGGTIALSSKDPRDRFSFIPTQSYGSYGTSLTHLELNSGKLENGGKLIASAQYISTETARTNADSTRKTGYVKYVQPVGSNTEITFLSNYNYIRFNNPSLSSLTLQQIATLGRHFGLDHDRTSLNCACYNYQTKQTDLEYLGVHSQLPSGWELDNKLYTYAYSNTSHESPFVGTKASPANTNIGGYIKINKYRAFGDAFDLIHNDDYGQFRTGGWYEFTSNDRSSVAIDYSRGGAVDVPAGQPVYGSFNANGKYTGPFKYTMNDRLRTTQLYAEYAWHASDRLTVTPGVKDVDFKRYINTPINQTTKTPLYYQQTSRKTLGFLTANYLLRDNWSIYATAAQGFLAPNLNEFYVPNPTKNKISPAQTTNYQFGTVYKSDRFNADADVYFINFKNYAFSTTIPGTTDAVYYQAKGAYIKGIEAEATYFLGRGTSLFVNGSAQDATFKGSNLDVPNVPNRTAALGVLYENQGFFGSLFDKYSGAQKAYNSNFNPDLAGTVKSTISSAGFWQAAASVGYGQKLNGSIFKSYKVRLEVDNLLASENLVINSVNGTTGSYYVLPGRSWFGSVSVAF